MFRMISGVSSSLNKKRFDQEWVKHRKLKTNLLRSHRAPITNIVRSRENFLNRTYNDFIGT